LRALFAAYLDAKQRQHVLDYGDLYWAQMMCEPAIAEDVACRFDHPLVDEYQDTNAVISLAAERSHAEENTLRTRKGVFDDTSTFRVYSRAWALQDSALRYARAPICSLAWVRPRWGCLKSEVGPTRVESRPKNAVGQTERKAGRADVIIAGQPLDPFSPELRSYSHQRQHV
jgi:hypothetical protein